MSTSGGGVGCDRALVERGVRSREGPSSSGDGVVWRRSAERE